MLQKHRNRRLKKTLCLESLEDRTLLSGNVNVIFFPGNSQLIVSSQSGNNALQINQTNNLGVPTLTVTGSSFATPVAPGNVTAINSIPGGSFNFPLSSISQLQVTLGNGTNTLLIGNKTGFSLPGNITITVGTDGNTILLNNISDNAGTISVTGLGGSTDNITETNVIAGRSLIATGTGLATITQNNVTLGWDIITTPGQANVTITNSTFRPPPRTYAIGVLQANLDTTVNYGDDHTNTLFIDKIIVGPTVIGMATGTPPADTAQKVKNNLTFSNSILQAATVTIGSEMVGSQTTNTVNLTNDVVTGTIGGVAVGNSATGTRVTLFPDTNLNVSLLNQSGVSGFLLNNTRSTASSTGSGAVNNLTMNNVNALSGGANMNIRVDDGIPYVNSSNVLTAASTVLMSLVDTRGGIGVTLGDWFQSVMIGTGTPGLNDVDAADLGVYIGSQNDIIVITANWIGRDEFTFNFVQPNGQTTPLRDQNTFNELIEIGDPTTQVIGGAAAPTPSVLINGVWKNDGDEHTNIYLGNNNRTDLGAGWSVTVNMQVDGNLTIGPLTQSPLADLRVGPGTPPPTPFLNFLSPGQTGNGWNLTVPNTTVGGTVNITMGNGGPGGTETLTLNTVTAGDLNITLNSTGVDIAGSSTAAAAKAQIPDLAQLGAIISLTNVQVNDSNGGLSLVDLGSGVDLVSLMNVNVVEALFVILSNSNMNVLSALNVTTGFGQIDMGPLPTGQTTTGNVYQDLGGNYGYYVTDALGFTALA